MKRIRLSGVLLVVLMSLIAVFWVLELLSADVAYDLAFKSLAVVGIYALASLAISSILGSKDKDESSSEE